MIEMIRDPYCPLAAGDCASETSFMTNLLALICAIVGTVWCSGAGAAAALNEIFVVFAIFLLFFSTVFETLFFPRRSSLWLRKKRRPLKWNRVFFREFALIVTLLVIGLVYWLFPKFADEDIRTFYHPFLGFLVPALVVLGIPYFCWMDRRDEEEEDVLCRIGRTLLTRRVSVNRFELANYVRSWAVKAFWLSFMQPSCVRKIAGFLHCDWSQVWSTPAGWFTLATALCYALDVAYASVGYLANFKLLNTHTRTADPTVWGWLAAICCYWPVWQILIQPYFLDYGSGAAWDKFFTVGSLVWWCWAVMIIVLELVYASATIAGGLRFSNLTYRGLWNTGPYRFTKHPAYVFKNVSWWLISLPLVFRSGPEALRCTALLVCVNAIYFLRARTEEKHLSHYPEYVAYALSMNEKSIFRGLARLFPVLRYRAPAPGSGCFTVTRQPL